MRRNPGRSKNSLNGLDGGQCTEGGGNSTLNRSESKTRVGVQQQALYLDTVSYQE